MKTLYQYWRRYFDHRPWRSVPWPLPLLILLLESYFYVSEMAKISIWSRVPNRTVNDDKWIEYRKWPKNRIFSIFPSIVTPLLYKWFMKKCQQLILFIKNQNLDSFALLITQMFDFWQYIPAFLLNHTLIFCEVLMKLDIS